jgi:enamine deaminase RidA (YjgF/YER057c/UK114 family)
MSIERTNFSSGLAWEPLRGYSRAVRAGNHLFISGTTAINAKGEVHAAGEPYEQTKYILFKCREILGAAGFSLTDVVRTRLYITQMSRWDDYAKAHREILGDVRPASSIVQVAKLVDPRLTIELEMEAVLGCQLVESKSLIFDK